METDATGHHTNAPRMIFNDHLDCVAPLHCAIASTLDTVEGCLM